MDGEQRMTLSFIFSLLLADFGRHRTTTFTLHPSRPFFLEGSSMVSMSGGGGGGLGLGRKRVGESRYKKKVAVTRLNLRIAQI